MRKKNLNSTFLSLTAMLCCLSLGLLLSTASLAQNANKPTPPPPTSPADCRSGCTSNDVQIIGAYLSDASGNPLTSYVCGSGVDVFLTLQLTTNTPRVGVSIYSDIQTVSGTPPTATGNSVGTVKQCFGNALNTTGSIVTFDDPITWDPCGSQIALVGTYTAWGTGNDQFCTSNDFQCGGTPSKCHAAVAGEIIIIQIPTPGTPPTPEACSETEGSYLAHFNLTTFENGLANGQDVAITWWSNYDGTSWTNELTGTNKTNHEVTSSSATVYAKICNSTTPTACANATVTLTVNPKPQLVTNNPAAVCSPATKDLTAAAITSGSTLNGATLAYFTALNPNVAVGTPSAVGNGTYYIIATTNKGCSDTATVTVTINTTPGAPSVCVVQPSLCGDATGKVKFTAITGAQYSINDGNTWSTCNVFLTVAPGSVTGLRVQSSDGCISTTGSCTTICAEGTSFDPCEGPTSKITSTTSVISETIESQTTVKAYPNPFSDRVKFMVTSSVAGNGNLEVYNMMGQKVKNVYQGYIVKGTQTFELSLPNQSVGNLVYVLRIGDKKMTGKILQINR